MAIKFNFKLINMTVKIISINLKILIVLTGSATNYLFIYFLE